MTSDSELYNDIVEMLSNGNFLQLNGKAINLTELNEYINAQQEEIERLNNIIVKLKKVLWQRCKETRKNEQYVRLNCYKDILNELTYLLMQGSDKE